MFFDMHADIWTNTLWEYEKGNKNIIRKKFRHKFEKGNMTGGIFVIWLDDYENPETRFIKALRIMAEELHYTKDFIHIVKNNEDFNTAKKNNKLAITHHSKVVADKFEKLAKTARINDAGA